MDVINLLNNLLNTTLIEHNYSNVMINLDNDIWKILISSFAAHGFLDFITFIPSIIESSSWYFTFITLFVFLTTYIPSIGMAIFVGSSMYHFGEDFRYLFNFDNKGTRWGGTILFGSSTIRGFGIWNDTLKWMGLTNPTMMTLSVFFMSIPSLFYIFYNPLCILLPLLIGIGGPYPFILIYACLLHTPLAIYRYLKSIDSKFLQYCCLGIWLGGTMIVYSILPYFKNINVMTVKLMFGVVVAHIIFLTRWQLKNKLDMLITNINESILP